MYPQSCATKDWDIAAVRQNSVSRCNGAPIKETPQYDSAVMIRGVSGGPQMGLHDAEKRQSLGQLCVFFSLEKILR